MATKRPQQKRQHYVPKFYLKRFAARGKSLRAYERPTRRVLKMSVQNAAVEADLYTVQMMDGKRSVFVESELAKLEGAASAALGRLAKNAFPPSDQDKAVIAEYVAWQYLRTPLRKRQQDAIMDDVAKFFMRAPWSVDGIRSAMEVGGQGPVADSDVADVKSLLDSGEFEDWDLRVSTEEWIRRMPESVATAASLILNRKWLLVEARGARFVTCDNPISLYANPETAGLGVGVGLQTADEVRFPLDPRHMLVFLHPIAEERAGWPVPNLVFPVTRSTVASINGLTCVHAQRWVFQHPDDDDISDQIPNVAHPIITINGKVPQRH